MTRFLRGTVVGLAVATVCLYLALRRGNVLDESEHAHVSWLICRLHEQPVQDFFQHHQPLLWDLLGVYFHLGGEGPEVLYFGRFLVAACVVLFGLAMVQVTRRFVRLGGRSAAGTFGTEVLALLPMLLLEAYRPYLLVIRPELLSIPLFVYAVLLWLPCPRGDSPRGNWRELGHCFGAGALFGAAVFASPRFVLLGGSFLLLPKDRARVLAVPLAPLAALALGAIAFWEGYALLTGYPVWTMLYFNMAASATLQKVGRGSLLMERELSVAAILAIVAWWIGRGVTGQDRIRYFLRGGYFLLVLAASVWSCWPHLYVQNLVVPVVWLGIVFAAAEGEIDWAKQWPKRAWVVGGGLALFATYAIQTIIDDARSELTIVHLVNKKNALLAGLQPTDTVLMSGATHPICVADASYYGSLLPDGSERMQAVADKMRPAWELPPCDYLRDVRQQKPALVDGFLWLTLSRNDYEELRRLLARDYDPTPPADLKGVPDTIFRRKPQSVNSP